MSSKNSEYWRRRFEILEEMQNKNASRTVYELEQHFNLAQKTLDDQIYNWYGRFAKNNNISLSEANKWLNAKELAELKWDVSEYIKHGKEVINNPTFAKQLENASARYHVSRLEALKLQTQQTMEKLYGNQTDIIESLMKRTYLDSFYHSVYEIQKGVGVGWDIAGINEDALKKVLAKPWTTDKETFSDRIWTQKEKLVSEVHTQLTQNMILGRSPDASIKAIAAKFNTSKSNAGRLVMTESAYFASVAQLEAYKSLGIEIYEFIGTLDGDTCSTCGDMDRKQFPLSQYQPGLTAEPLHPRCRCTTAPYFDDSDEGERIARNEEGKNYHIPSDIKYNDWKKTFVEEGNKDGLKPDVKNVKLIDSEEKAVLDYITAKSYSVNAKLRSGTNLSSEEEAWIQQLDNALEKLPKYEGVVYRSISDFGIGDVQNFISDHKPGQYRDYSAYVSASTQIYDDSFPIQYIIECKTGRDLRHYNEAESEILFQRKSRFRIKKVDGNKIYMEEL